VKEGKVVLKILGWAGYDQGLSKTFESFTKETGISVSFRGVRNQDDMHRAAEAEAFDIACPTTDRLASWLNSGLITTLDDDRIGYARIDKAYHADDHTIIQDRRYGAPSLWGGAGIGHNTRLAPLDPTGVSLMALFDPAFAGRLTIREDTAFVAAGRALGALGRLPYQFDDSYEFEDRMIANYDVIIAFLVDHATHVARFWFSEEEGIEAFLSGDCVIGYNWDTTIAALQRQAMSCGFIAPEEGTNCYLQNFVLSEKADPGSAQDWISWVNTPKGSAMYAMAFGANPTATGAWEFLPAEDQAFFTASYPAKALDRLWWQPEQPMWFVKHRQRYANKFRAAVEG